MKTFDELVASRRRWLDEVLKPWCQSANRQDLIRAALEWGDLAGRVDEDATLWSWAWSRFPALVHEGLSVVNETKAVRVTLKTGEVHTGFPDARESKNGQLVLIPAASARDPLGPFSLDDIERVDEVSMDAS